MREPARRLAHELLDGDGLDPEIVDLLEPKDVTYTPSRAEAEAAVDRGEAEGAFLLRPTKIEDVWDVARRGEVGRAASRVNVPSGMPRNWKRPVPAAPPGPPASAVVASAVTRPPAVSPLVWSCTPLFEVKNSACNRLGCRTYVRSPVSPPLSV